MDSTFRAKSAVKALLCAMLMACLPGCWDPPGGGLQIKVGRSFREMGVRKTSLVAQTCGASVRVLAARASPGIELPSMSLPFVVKELLALEIEWKGQSRNGQVFFRTDASPEELVVNVSYP